MKGISICLEVKNIFLIPNQLYLPRLCRCVFECNAVLFCVYFRPAKSSPNCTAIRTITWTTCWSLLLLQGSRGSLQRAASCHRYTLLLGALLTLLGVQEMTLLLLWLSPTTGQKDPLDNVPNFSKGCQQFVTTVVCLTIAAAEQTMRTPRAQIIHNLLRDHWYC